MDAFVTRKKRKPEPDPALGAQPSVTNNTPEESTDLKLAILSSLHPALDQEMLLDILLAHDGNVEATSQTLRARLPKNSGTGNAVVAQSSLRSFAVNTSGSDFAPPSKRAKVLSRKGATLHLYDPIDISEHTPCTIIHNFLPAEEADSLLKELLEESKSFEKITFKLFDNVVSSPHTLGFYVGSYQEMQEQKHAYVYNGSRMADVRTLTPQLERVKARVQEAVNREIQERIRTRYGGKKLKFQSPGPWTPNAAFVNCYNGPQESVGWHSDQLTYLGPRPVIGSLSLGVTREFRVRRVLPQDDTSTTNVEAARDQSKSNDSNSDLAGQIAIHLPHNSLLVMHADMQEEWKHSIAPAQAIDPHPVAGNRRINITYRHYRPGFHPRNTPRCPCGVPAVLRVVTKKRENWGRYFWMCHAGNVPGKEACEFFKWAEFDDDGDPLGLGCGDARDERRKEAKKRQEIREREDDSGKCDAGGYKPATSS
ncbi:alpha-ketoglutarate-dependent dioxygenase alkB 3 [Corynascus novoguineensis]|uniref:Alpha-ketoglutarate-dependent dioxygenase alkB 3 n=1 Tax=Corynascus novoguineensis TaxID=1126955 RepID=A0AAN7HUF4_9PEZI|nr:alpha-ketoglutarate-dependent dioxygenase alkB 3 [Corynascus novoguineensis]